MTSAYYDTVSPPLLLDHGAFPPASEFNDPNSVLGQQAQRRADEAEAQYQAQAAAGARTLQRLGRKRPASQQPILTFRGMPLDQLRAGKPPAAYAPSASVGGVGGGKPRDAYAPSAPVGNAGVGKPVHASDRWWRRLRSRDNDRSMQSGAPFPPLAHTDAWVAQHRYYDPMVHDWLKGPGVVEARFERTLRDDGVQDSEFVPDNYLANFEWQLRRINDAWRMVPDFHTVAIFSDVVFVKLMIDRPRGILILYEIVSRPCAEGQGFFRLVLYQLAITCVQNGLDLWINSPLDRTQALMKRISPTHGQTVRYTHPDVSSANTLWIQMPLAELRTWTVDDLGIRDKLLSKDEALAHEHKLRMTALEGRKWVRLPKDDRSCQNEALDILQLDQKGALMSAGDFCEAFLEIEQEYPNGPPLPYVQDLIGLRNEVQFAYINDYMTNHGTAWTFFEPQEALRRVVALLGPKVIVQTQSNGCIEGLQAAISSSSASGLTGFAGLSLAGSRP